MHVTLAESGHNGDGETGGQEIEIEYAELPNLTWISRARLMRLLGRLSGTFLSPLISRDHGVTLGLISYQGYPAIRYWFSTR